ncbi:TPA: calcium-binding adhesion protein [Clostridioides difficile]|nr:M60 family metallopeptidase [Clostridioides difficile]HBF3361564.1 calcium-binding adhesion protein [Clostridioides difficile]HBF3471113.1 calcium-binding adhesion protein [Clostridioides difficile]
MKKAISCVLAVFMCSAPLNVFAEPILEGKLRAVEKSVTEKLRGSLEVDLNFSLPIKNSESESMTNMQLRLKDDSNNSGIIKLGEKDSGTVNVGTDNIEYTIKKLSASRSEIKNKDDNISYYNIVFNNLPVGKYNVEVSGAGFKNKEIKDIDISSYSQRVLLSNRASVDNKNKPLNYELFLMGDVNGDGKVDKSDYNKVLENIDSNKREFDLNRDGKVDIVDLDYVQKNLGQSEDAKSLESIVSTNPIVDTSKVELKGNSDVDINGNVENLFSGENNGVTISSKNDEISEEKPAVMDIALSEALNMEVINIKAPEGTAPAKGIVEVTDKDGNVQQIPYENKEYMKNLKDEEQQEEVNNEQEEVNQEEVNNKDENINQTDNNSNNKDESNDKQQENSDKQEVNSNTNQDKNNDKENSSMDKPNSDEETPKEEGNISKDDNSTTSTYSRSALETYADVQNSDIVINLGKQVAVKKITIKITATTANDRNLAEISKVEFLNNVYKEIPKPEMNIPKINKILTSTAVGNEKVSFYWNNEVNVSAYELILDKIDSKGKVLSTKKLQTSKNTIEVRDIEAYGLYRVSIQSLNGDWSSGYKDATPENLDGVPENVDSNYKPIQFSPDSILEFQVVPDTKPEPPEGINVKGKFKSLDVSWKNHKQAKDFDLYYKEKGSNGSWIKYNDKLIRGTSSKIEGLKDNTTYEVRMTATNHLGTSGMSKTYIGTTESMDAPTTPNYRLINTPKENGGFGIPTNHIVDVTYPAGYDKSEYSDKNPFDKFNVVDGDFTTHWTFPTYNAAEGTNRGPIITFDKSYTMDTFMATPRFDVSDKTINDFEVRYWDENGQLHNLGDVPFETKTDPVNNNKYVMVRLKEPITATKIQVSVCSSYSYKSNISELKFYEYDSIEDDVRNLFMDDLQVELKEDVTQEKITELKDRLNTPDKASGEYHPYKTVIERELKLAQDLYNDRATLTDVTTVNQEINKLGKYKDKNGQYTVNSNNLGMQNDWQALGVAARAGDEITVYVGSKSGKTPKLIYTQYYGESGAYKSGEINLNTGKNVIQLSKLHSLDIECGGSLYIRYAEDTPSGGDIKVRVAGATKIPHLNLNGTINDKSPAGVSESKKKIKAYIEELAKYKDAVKGEPYYPGTNVGNSYGYSEKTGVLNTTDIESDKVTLNVPATAVYQGISKGNADLNTQVDRLYNSMLAWEQIMDLVYSERGVFKTQDLDGNGTVDDNEFNLTKNDMAPKSRMNIKYQRMFIGAFMYASGLHVGVEYGSVPGLMNGVPFQIDDSGKATGGNLFGWGIGHEIGHVTDIGKMTYSETSNNVLALLAQTFDDKTHSRLEGSTMDKIYEHVTSNSLGIPSNVFERLGMLWQLHLAYDDDFTGSMLKNNSDADLSNDTFYAKISRKYRALSSSDPINSLPKDQMLVAMASSVVEKDLRDYFKAWGVEITPELNSIMDSKNYEKESRKIQYVNDEARRKILNENIASMAKDTKVSASFSDGIQSGSLVKSNKISIDLDVDKDKDKILGYEIIRSDGNYLDGENGTQVKYRTVGFVDAKGNSKTKFTDNISPLNNRAFTYKVVAYDYHLNPTEEFEVGTVKLSDEGKINKSAWSFITNTVSDGDVRTENDSHGPLQNPEIDNIKDNDASTTYKGKIISKAEWNKDPQKDPDINVEENPYIIVDMKETLPIVGLKYTKPEAETRKFSLKGLFNFRKNTSTTYNPLTNYKIQVSNDKKNWEDVSQGTFEYGQDLVGGGKDQDNEARITFNKDGKLWTYQARYVKLISNNKSNIEVAELDIIGPPGDNIEIGTMNNADETRTNGIGKLAEDYVYQSDDSSTSEDETGKIPAGSIVITGEYSGNPAFNLPLLIDKNNKTISGEALLFAEVPEKGELGEISKGTWVYYMPKENFDSLSDKVKAELYRYNDLQGDTPVGQRFVSDTMYVPVGAKNYDELKTISLTDSNSKTRKATRNSIDISNKKVITVSNKVKGNIVRDK